MKIKCPHCNTAYNIDDSKISARGLLVKCSVCNNQYRVKKKVDEPEDDDIVGKIHSQMNVESGPVNELQNGPVGEKKNSDDGLFAGNDDSGLFDDEDDLSESSEPEKEDTSVYDQLENDDDGEENTVNFQIGDNTADENTMPHKEGKKPDQESAPEKLDFSDDRFSADDLFDDGPAENIERNDAMNLFDDISDEDNDSDSSSLFKDNPLSADVEEDLVSDEKGQASQKPDMFLNDLFNNAEPTEKVGGVYFRKKNGEVIGPFEESEIETLMENGVISSDDDISSDGVTWNEEAPQDGSSLSMGSGYDFSLEEEDDLFKTLDSEDNEGFSETGISDTGIFKDAVGEFEGTSMNTQIGGQSSESVDHVFIPEDLSEGENEKTGPAKNIRKKKSSGAFGFYAVLVLSTLIVIALLGGGYYYYVNYIQTDQGDILDNISESIAVNTGTLSDVRESLNKDIPEEYIKSIGILKQYIKEDDSAPTAVGLDGQVKFNLILSYNKRVETIKTTGDKIEKGLQNAPSNIDLIKARALYLIINKNFDEAVMLVEEFAKSNDPEIFYILGLCAAGKKDLKKAEEFFNHGFINSQGKSAKIMFSLADMKYKNGDAQSAAAFLNRIIDENRNYLKAHLLKANILMNTKDRIDEADEFLRGVSASVISSAEDFQKADYYQMIASIAYRKGNLTEAIKYYEKAVAINKTDIEALIKIGDFYVKTSNSSKAMQYYERALKIDPKHPSAVLGKTEIFIQLGQKDRVYLELAKIDIKSVKDAPSLIRLGRIYDIIGDKAKSLEFYDLAIKADPAQVEPYLAKMVILVDFGKTKEISELAAIVGKLGKDTYAYNLVKAVILHEEGEYEKAKRYYNKAVERNTIGDERVYFYYGKFLYDQQKYSRATENLKRAYFADQRRYEYLQAYAESLEKERKWKEVIKLLESGDYQEKGMFKSYLSLANAFYNLKKYKEAINNVDKALELNSQSSYIFYMKAKIYYAMGKYDNAEKEIDTAVVLDMKNFDNYTMYARILSKKGDFKGAIEKIEAAEKIDSDNQELMLMKGIVYKNIDDYRNALKYFRKVKSKRLRKEAYLEIGESYLQLNRPKEALAYFKRAQRSGNKLASQHLARIYYEAGDLNKAVKFYKKALAVDSTDSIALRQLGYIYKERKTWAKSLSYFKRYLKYVDDPYEKKMIEDEIFFLRKSMPAGQNNPVRTEGFEGMDKADIEAVLERAKELYVEGRALRKENPEAARQKFREVMKIVPKGNRYYEKAFRAFKKLENIK